MYKSLLITCFLCLFLQPAFATIPTAKNGVFDLDDIIITDETRLPLNGEWEYYPGEFISSQSTSNPQIVQVPKLLSKQGFDPINYGSYRLVITNHDPSIKLGISIPDIYTSYKVFVNGEEVLEKGKVADRESEYTPYIQLNTIQLESSGPTIELIIHIANFKHHKYGITDPVIIGNFDALFKEQSNSKSLDAFLTGCLVMGAFFFLGLYYFGRHETAALYFALFCLCYAYRIIGWENYALHDLFPAYPWLVSIRVEYISFYLSGFFFARYVRHLFPEETPTRYAKGVEYISLIWVALTLTLPPRYFTQINIPYLFVMLVGLTIVAITYVRASLMKRQGAKHSLFSIAGISIVFVLKTLAYLKVMVEPVLVTVIGQLTFFFFQGMSLSELFSSSWKLAKSKAEEASQAKSDFLSIMSHEIRTPLNAIIGTTYHLLDEDPREDQKSELKDLKIASENLLSLINNILDFNRIDSGKVEFEENHLNFRKYIETFINSHKWLSNRKDIEIDFEIEDDVPEYVILDKIRMTQVLTNLVGNAIKFTEKGEVKLKVSRISNPTDLVYLNFEIIDTGVGIPEDKKELVFKAFEQGNNSVSRKFGGTGLGLNITMKLLQLMGAKLSFESEEGKGSNFYFTLLVKEGEESKSINPDKINYDLGGAKVLLVEDNEMNTLVATRLLQKWNTKVDVAENGKIAVDLNGSNEYDIILMDIQMPEMDGYTASRKIREAGYDLPIVALTASALLDTKEKLRASGLNGLVTKPFEPADLFMTMKELLDSKG